METVALYLKDWIICAAEPIVGGSKEKWLIGRRAEVQPGPKRGGSEWKRALEVGSQFPLQVDSVFFYGISYSWERFL